MATQTDLHKVWMVVSPQNPLKPKKTLAKDFDRLHLLRLGLGDNAQIEASNVEFNLPQPSYTINTLTYLKEKYPDREFALIMGGDNLATLHLWKNYEQILANYDIYVYQRPGIDLGQFADHPRVKISTAPLLDISATTIRNYIKDGHSIRYLVPDSVFEYLQSSRLYKE